MHTNLQHGLNAARYLGNHVRKKHNKENIHRKKETDRIKNESTKRLKLCENRPKTHEAQRNAPRTKYRKKHNNKN